MTKGKAPRRKSEKQRLIEALLFSTSGANWMLEMRSLKLVLAKYPDVGFWFDFSKKHKYQTLFHLLGDIKSTNIVHLAYHDYTKRTKLELKSPESVKLSPEKIGEDIIIPQKPKTLLDFIK